MTLPLTHASSPPRSDCFAIKKIVQALTKSRYPSSYPVVFQLFVQPECVFYGRVEWSFKFRSLEVPVLDVGKISMSHDAFQKPNESDLCRLKVLYKEEIAEFQYVSQSFALR